MGGGGGGGGGSLRRARLRGNLRCAPGNSEATLRAIAKDPQGRKRPCGCTLGGRSWRRGRLGTLKTQRAF